MWLVRRDGWHRPQHLGEAGGEQKEVFDLDSAPNYNALHQLPAPPPDFTGREKELNELLAKLGQGVTIFGIHGLGGVGKTAHALKLAERIQDRCRLKKVDVGLNLSYEMLNEEQRRLWRALAVFPQSFDEEAVAAVWQMERDAPQDAPGDLMKLSLVEFNAETGRYRLPDLASLFAEAKAV